MDTVQCLANRVRSILEKRNNSGWPALVENIPPDTRETYVSAVSSWPPESESVTYHLVHGSIVARGEKQWCCTIQRRNRARGYFWVSPGECRTSYFSVSDAHLRGKPVISRRQALNSQQLLDQLQSIDQVKCLSVSSDGQAQVLAEYLGFVGHASRLDSVQICLLYSTENQLAVEIVGFESPMSIGLVVAQDNLFVTSIAGQSTYDYLAKRMRIWSYSGVLNDVS